MAKKLFCIILALMTLLPCMAYATETSTNSEQPQYSQRPATGQMPQGGMPRGNRPQRDMPQNGEFQNGQVPPMPPDGFDREMPSDGNIPTDRGFGGEPRGSFRQQMQSENTMGKDSQNQFSVMDFINKNLSPIVAIVSLILGFIFVIFYKKDTF